MALTIDDLKPKNFKVNIKGVELESKPLRLSHALVLSKIASIFQNPENVAKQKILEAEKDLDEIISELIPELKDIQLELSGTTQLIEQLMSSVEPEGVKELRESGVEFNEDPKALKVG